MTLLLVAAAFAQDPGTGTLEQAYQKEYAYLRAERAELESRLAELKGESESRVSSADAELERLQGRLVGATRKADVAEDSFDAIERETAAMDDAAVLLGSTVELAADSLNLGPQPDAAAAVPVVFKGASDYLRSANEVGQAPGSFFLPDGTKVEGTIYKWGQVAAWGSTADDAGALAPAGEGTMQLRHEFGVGTAQALAAGTVPATLDVQLFEAEKAATEAEEEGGLLALLKESGTMGQLLFGLGCISATLVAIRALTLLFARRGGMPLIEAVAARIQADRMDEARKLVARRNNPTARVVGAILDGAERERHEVERLVDEALIQELPKVDRFASALVVITAGSPLLGLLGTVTGMIATFDVITEHGTGNPKLMSAGIAEALICTAFGLAVAIPTLLAGNVLASWGDSIKRTLDRAALGTLNALDLRSQRKEAA